MKEVYDKHKDLKLAAEELGIKWQNLYVYLREAGHPVTGNKERYGRLTDKMARSAEKLFQKTIPHAEDMNENKFQAKLDFLVNGLKVDVKASPKRTDTKIIQEKKMQLTGGHFVVKYKNTIKQIF